MRGMMWRVTVFPRVDLRWMCDAGALQPVRRSRGRHARLVRPASDSEHMRRALGPSPGPSTPWPNAANPRRYVERKGQMQEGRILLAETDTRLASPPADPPVSKKVEELT